ncbi:phage antirepressor KilAC domain-containing protein [Canibacter zhoujuaniae]|uniref:phage antirepressor KilAC domain-containing protein n=1 Tax=Canibacter zhoujuaniae TaxID=2708343 RepID=UPI00141EE2CC|nr:phage antirepressor KilAC domain-containing protein [Canibacter zhoujuaniae]
MANDTTLQEFQNPAVRTIRTTGAYLKHALLQSRDSLTIGVIAKDYGFSAQRLNKLLHELGIQHKQSGIWLLYQQYAGYGYTDTKTYIINDKGHTRVHTYWTQKGRLFIYEILKAQGILPVIEQDRKLYPPPLKAFPM